MQKTEWQSVLYAYVLIKLYIKIAPCLFWEKGCSCSFDLRLVSCILFSFHRIASLDGLPCHHFHVCLIVLSVKESDGTKARVCLNKLQMSGFGHHGTPYGPFIFIARNGRMDRCGIASRNCSDRNIVIHAFFLSQPLSGCLQKPYIIVVAQHSDADYGSAVYSGFPQTEFS